MGFLGSDHPHTSITETLNRLTKSKNHDLEVEIGTLVDLIRTRDKYQYNENQLEAARTLRKKFKYGDKTQISRSFDIMDLLISQGIKLSVMYNDFKLLDSMNTICSQLNDKQGLMKRQYSSKLSKKGAQYAISWNEYIVTNGLRDTNCYMGLYDMTIKIKQSYDRTKNDPNTSNDNFGTSRSNTYDRNSSNSSDDSRSMDRYNAPTNRPGRRGRGGSNAGRRNFMNDTADNSIFGESSQVVNNPDRLYRIPTINMKKETPKIKNLISDALAASTALQNALIMLPDEQNAMLDKNATESFVKARNIRRKVLRYLQLITEGDFLGSLIHANDELVNALTLYDEKSWEESENDSADDGAYSDTEDEESYNNNRRSKRYDDDNDYDSGNIYQSDNSDGGFSMAANNPFADNNKL
ncbi:similar to Saccharomyces cerevisiae YCL034W LSB5 Protein of unknown function [Maudiozyma barnettii]|uniref:VHS domain-containing protein n=1 Tax=Maudiozyma barnettii TaxID=61262 RepID=A0A8H2VDN2_9SACH|nr:Lsb5p [Kazachstania barnettii]CAB4253332.1 similar to Saccharomyces cerevisiae YCL034W LSB5 Protein of unknown function [Kazachstania barnettii]CAD1780856.1 similar to Saccharomyces cerevisiae YCL034W LSB5 Protein of unknown function [Kazachstania barnettii]